MKIQNDHLYHGSALLQIAEHSQFTAINAISVAGKKSRSAYRINDSVGVYLKYASKPTKAFQEYQFTFTEAQISELDDIASQMSKVFVALVCVKDRQIACLDFEDLQSLVGRREKEKGMREDQYVVLVTAPEGKSLRAYVNKPGKRKVILGSPIVIGRNSFPSRLFAG